MQVIDPLILNFIYNQSTAGSVVLTACRICSHCYKWLLI